MADNDISTGGLGTTFKVDADQAITTLGRVKQATDRAREATERYNRAGGHGDGGLLHGAQHVAQHAARHAGLGGLSFAGGPYALALTAGAAVVTYAYEKWRQSVEAAAKSLQDSIKSAEGIAGKAYSQNGADARTVHNLSMRIPVSADKAAEVVSKVRSRYRGASEDDLYDAIKEIQANAPNAKGAEELAGEMLRSGIPLENFGMLVQESGNRPDKLAERLKQIRRTTNRKGLDPVGVATRAAQLMNEDLDKREGGEKEQEKNELRALRRMTKDQAKFQADVGENTDVMSTPEQELFRSQEELEDAKKRAQTKEAIDSDIARKRQFAVEMDKLNGGHLFGDKPEDMEKWIESNNTYWSGGVRPFENPWYSPWDGFKDRVRERAMGQNGSFGPMAEEKVLRQMAEATENLKHSSHHIRKAAEAKSHQTGSGE
jgi:hypothetical protein